jgi:hypothetical protein
MTVANQTNRVQARGNNSAGQIIPFYYPISATSDLLVIQVSRTTGVETELTETTDYTVEILGDTGGNVSLVSAIGTGFNIMVVRRMPYTQSMDLEQGDAFVAENVEDAIDKNTKLILQNKDRIDRGLVAPDGDPTSITDNMELPSNIDRASAYLYFDASGLPTAVNPLTTGTASISNYMETILDDVNEATFKATTNLETGTDIQAWDAQLDDIAALAVTDGNIIVADGSNWVAESGATARASIGAIQADDILVYEEEVLCYEGNVLTYI